MRRSIYCILYVPILYILGLSIPSSGLYSLCSIQNEWLYQITLILSYVMDNVGGILNIFFSSLSFYFFSSPHLFLLGIITTVQLRIRLWPSDQMLVTCLFLGCLYSSLFMLRTKNLVLSILSYLRNQWSDMNNFWIQSPAVIYPQFPFGVRPVKVS